MLVPARRDRWLRGDERAEILISDLGRKQHECRQSKAEGRCDAPRPPTRRNFPHAYRRHNTNIRVRRSPMWRQGYTIAF